MKFGRRQIVRSAGAALLFSPFYSVLEGRPARAAAGRRAKRLFIFFSMGTSPQIWTPSSVTSETDFTFSASTAPLADIKQHVVLIEGLASANPGNNHGAPDSLTGLGFGGKPLISVDQYIAMNLKAKGVNSAIPSLLLSADGTAGGGKSAFHNEKMLPLIASPTSAFNTVFGAAAPVGTAPDKLIKRRKSVLDLVKGEISTLQKALGVDERQKLDFHLQSLKQMENRLAMAGQPGAASCKKPLAPADSPNPQKANQAHLDIAVSALACDITRVAAVEWGSDQTMQVNLPEIGLQGDQHGGFIHSGGPAFKNLIQMEVWLAQRFVEVVNKLKAIPEADGSGTLLDNSLVVWARDMGDAPGHNQKSMRFVLASGSGGFLKTSPTGRYLKNAGGGADRHERVLLYLCDAMGISDFSGFGDKALADKTPISALSA